MPAPPVESETGRAILRFAPSPNGRLHLGHAYSALLNDWIARQLGGKRLLRIEDIDPTRSRPELIAAIHDDLAWLGLRFDRPVRRQSAFLPVYAEAVEDLAVRGLAYPCFCSRGAIAARVAAGEGAGLRDPDGTPHYPGTCRTVPPDEAGRRRADGEPHTWRLDMTRALAVAPGPHLFVCFTPPEPFSPHAGRGPNAPRRALDERREGEGRSTREARSEPSSHLRLPPRFVDDGVDEAPSPRAGRGDAHAIRTDDPETVFSKQRKVSADPARWGDAVIARRDVLTSYHLAVVLDDAAQGITHVVRGEDLRAATDLHVLLQRLLRLGTPAYHHHGLIRGDDGQKLAKSKGSETLADLRKCGISAEEVRAMLGF